MELQENTKKFVLVVRKKNGKEYEHSFLAKSLSKAWSSIFAKISNKTSWTVNVQVYKNISTEKSSKIRCENKLKITVSDG